MPEFVVPPASHRWLAEAPIDRPVVVLMRHSVRPPIPPGETGNELLLTEEGERLAAQLGETVGRRLASLRTSPVKRCVQTAEALARGAGVHLDVAADRLLGEPGAYVANPELAWEQVWRRMAYEEIINAVVDGRPDLPGFARPRRAAGRLLEHMLEHATTPGVHVFVTHDSVVLPTAAHLLGRSLRKPDWPWYLDTVVIWREGDGYEIRYREHAGRCAGAGELIADEFTCEAVLDHGRRQLHRALGSDFQGRLFLAGGCFKSLLTGKPPRELDIWAASEADRALLLDTLARRGARPLPGARPFGDAFECDGLVIDVPKKTLPATLEDRLGRFDLALSAAGVEYEAGRMRAVLHPLAQESVRRRRVLFLKPLVNWRYALVSLERARRYSAELGYVIDAEEEQVVWQVFDEQATETQQGMIDRYQQHGRGQFGVPAEVASRCR